VEVIDWHSLQDDELLDKYVKGHFEGFEHLYSRHKGGTYRFILRQVNDESTAEDLLQELWMKVVSNARTFNKNSKFSTWLYQVARNLLVDRFRHLEVVTAVISQEEPELEASLESTDLSEAQWHQQRQKQALKGCLEKLPKAQLESFLLKEEAALIQTDIAQVVGISLEATKSRLRAAYANLRECLERQLGERKAER
jgi:RNA polymerase sigma-70 factor (ECF subfamily)